MIASALIGALLLVADAGSCVSQEEIDRLESVAGDAEKRWTALPRGPERNAASQVAAQERFAFEHAQIRRSECLAAEQRTVDASQHQVSAEAEAQAKGDLEAWKPTKEEDRLFLSANLCYHRVLRESAKEDLDNEVTGAKIRGTIDLQLVGQAHRVIQEHQAGEDRFRHELKKRKLKQVPCSDKKLQRIVECAGDESNWKRYGGDRSCRDDADALLNTMKLNTYSHGGE